MLAIITKRVPRYTQSLHPARTMARAPSEDAVGGLVSKGLGTVH